jgi:TRAP transporter TAXI family solute receptor
MPKLPCSLMICAAMVTVSISASARDLAIGALPENSPVHGLAGPLAQVFARSANLSLRVVASERSAEALLRLEQGKLSMALASAVDANLSRRGTKGAEGGKASNIRVLARLLSYRAGFVVRRESDIHTVADFKGRRFPKPTATNSVLRILARAAFATRGMSFKDISSVPVEALSQSMPELVAGRIEGSFIAPGARAVRDANASVNLRFLSLRQSPRTASLVHRIAPGAFFSVVRPSRRISFIDKPTTVLGVDYLILIRSDVKSKLAYEAVKALYLNRRSLIARQQLFRGFQPTSMSKKGVGPPYHPGAIKFYDEAGIW